MTFINNILEKDPTHSYYGGVLYIITDFKNTTNKVVPISNIGIDSFDKLHNCLFSSK